MVLNLFFVTKTAKPRIVYDGAATAGGVSLNRAVLAGENLLSGLVDVSDGSRAAYGATYAIRPTAPRIVENSSSFAGQCRTA